MTDKERYRAFAEQEKNLPLFLQPWWLDAVTEPDGKQWEVLLYENEEGEVEAAMPYMLRQRMGFRYILMPQQTQIGGVWLSNKVKGDLQKQEKIVDWLIVGLRELRLDYYYQQYPIDSPLPNLLEKKGFTIRKRITYRIENIVDTEALVQSFSTNKKRQLKKAASLIVDNHCTAQDFYTLHATFLRERHRVIRYSWNLFHNIYQQATAHEQGQIIALRQNPDSPPIAAAFVVWDNYQIYYLIPTYQPSTGHLGAGARLVLECIKTARQKGLAFDFEGSNVLSIANHYRQFGSTPTEYYSVEKIYSPLFLLLLFCNKMKEKLRRQ